MVDRGHGPLRAVQLLSPALLSHTFAGGPAASHTGSPHAPYKNPIV